MKDKEKEFTAVIETVLRETKNCGMSIETLTDYLVDRIKNKFIIEDSIIFSRKEYEKLKYTWITDRDAYKKGCKETAEKFVNETINRKQTLMNPYTDDESECVSTFWVYELAKQFGVEIKE